MYLDTQQIQAHLSLGRAIEQWIGTYQEYDYTAIKWIRIEKNKASKFELWYHDVIDEGDEDFHDIYEFSDTDPDMMFGKTDTFNTVDEVIRFAIEQYGCKIDRFVGSGMIQEEYARYLSSRKY